MMPGSFGVEILAGTGVDYVCVDQQHGLIGYDAILPMFQAITVGLAILSYEARATRSNGEPYSALVSTGYARRDDGWKMMFHQQTPLDQASQVMWWAVRSR